MTFTTDATLITRVWVSFNYDDLFGEDENVDYSRLMSAYEKCEQTAREQFPNATDIMIGDGGWEGNSAQFSPRADNPDDDIVYETFFDWLTELTDSLAS